MGGKKQLYKRRGSSGEKVYHCHNLNIQSRNATSLMSCLAPTWLWINKMSPITRGMLSHTNPEDSVSLAQPPRLFITPVLYPTLSNFLSLPGIRSFKAMFSASLYSLHISAFTEKNLPPDPVFLQ